MGLDSSSEKSKRGNGLHRSPLVELFGCKPWARLALPTLKWWETATSGDRDNAIYRRDPPRRKNCITPTSWNGVAAHRSLGLEKQRLGDTAQGLIGCQSETASTPKQAVTALQNPRALALPRPCDNHHFHWHFHTGTFTVALPIHRAVVNILKRLTGSASPIFCPIRTPVLEKPPGPLHLRWSGRNAPLKAGREHKWDIWRARLRS